jgi:hypothetical protein
MSNLNEDEIYAIIVVTRILASISLTGLLCVFFLFWFFKSLRSFALELVVWLCFSSVLFNIQYFFPIQNLNGHWCQAQAIISGAFDISSMIWTTIIGYTAYISINNYDYLNLNKNKYRIVFFILANVIPIAVISM